MSVSLVDLPADALSVILKHVAPQNVACVCRSLQRFCHDKATGAKLSPSFKPTREAAFVAAMTAAPCLTRLDASALDPGQAWLPDSAPRLTHLTVQVGWPVELIPPTLAHAYITAPPGQASQEPNSRLRDYLDAVVAALAADASKCAVHLCVPFSVGGALQSAEWRARLRFQDVAVRTRPLRLGCEAGCFEDLKSAKVYDGGLRSDHLLGDGALPRLESLALHEYKALAALSMSQAAADVLPRLRVLSLTDCDGVRDAFVAPLARLPALESLALVNCSAVAVLAADEPAAFARLTALSLQRCARVVRLAQSATGAFPRLRTLSVQDCSRFELLAISGDRSFAALTALTATRCPSFRCIAERATASFSSLQRVQLTAAARLESGGLLGDGPLPALEDFVCTECAHSCVSELRLAASCPQLTSLVLDCAGVVTLDASSDSCFAGLERMTVSNDPDLSSFAAAGAAAFPALRSLTLTACRPVASVVRAVSDLLPALTFLAFDNCEHETAAGEVLAAPAPVLNWLVLLNCPDLKPQHLSASTAHAGFPSLECLALLHCPKLYPPVDPAARIDAFPALRLLLSDGDSLAHWLRYTRLGVGRPPLMEITVSSSDAAVATALAALPAPVAAVAPRMSRLTLSGAGSVAVLRELPRSALASVNQVVFRACTDDPAKDAGAVTPLNRATALEFRDCHNLASLPPWFAPAFPCLKALSFSTCGRLEALPGAPGEPLAALDRLTVRDCLALQRLAVDRARFPALRNVVASGCVRLAALSADLGTDPIVAELEVQPAPLAGADTTVLALPVASELTVAFQRLACKRGAIETDAPGGVRTVLEGASASAASEDPRLCQTLEIARAPRSDGVGLPTEGGAGPPEPPSLLLAPGRGFQSIADVTAGVAAGEVYHGCVALRLTSDEDSRVLPGGVCSVTIPRMQRISIWQQSFGTMRQRAAAAVGYLVSGEGRQ